MIVELIAWHLGALHPIEKALTFGLAFGPFLILFVVVAVRRRQDQAADQAAEQAVTGAAATPDRSGPPSSTP